MADRIQDMARRYKERTASGEDPDDVVKDIAGEYGESQQDIRDWIKLVEDGEYHGT